MGNNGMHVTRLTLRAMCVQIINLLPMDLPNTGITVNVTKHSTSELTSSPLTL